MLGQLEQNDLSPTLADLIAMERNEGIEKGLAQGKLAGEEKSRKDIAVRLLQKKFDIEEVAEITKLSVEEVQKLKDGLM